MLYYIKKRTETITSVLRESQDQIATTTEKKETLIYKIIFSSLLNFKLGKPVSSDSKHRYINKIIVERVLFSQAVQKVSELDRLNFKIL
jgi:hypothetical protein